MGGIKQKTCHDEIGMPVPQPGLPPGDAVPENKPSPALPCEVYRFRDSLSRIFRQFEYY